MRLTSVSIQNFRSIANIENLRIERLQALVGANNSGKSNILKSIQCFLTAGAGGMKESDFQNPEETSVIECTFSDLTPDERRKLRPYLLGGQIVLRKEIRREIDEAKDKISIKAEYHGYQAEPQAEHLSIHKLIETHGNRPKWAEIAAEAGILDYVQTEDEKVTKASYQKGIERFVEENEVEYDEPILGETQVLGFATNLLASLPSFYLLPAITDYSNEVDRRSSSTVFRKLMGDLSERVMKADPRYVELEQALSTVRSLLNSEGDEENAQRLPALTTVEQAVCDEIRKMMPSVQSVHLNVEVEETKEIFSRGVNIKINDGALTDVLDKGHGMQRSLIFALLQMLMSSENVEAGRPIILCIEEPELYIHPHSQRLIFRVLREFAGLTDEDNPNEQADQVIYTTHSPSFVDVWNYERIAVVTKIDAIAGTKIKQADKNVLGDANDRATFKLLNSFGIKHNEVFFSRYAIVVEGVEDEVGVMATARKLNLMTELPEELGITIVVGGGKGEVAKFQILLNAFEIPFGVLLEMDGKGEHQQDAEKILANLNDNRISKIPNRVEDLLGLQSHFKDQRAAKNFFSDPNNINADMETVVQEIWPAN